MRTIQLCVHCKQSPAGFWVSRANAAVAEPDGSGAGLLLDGVVLRLQADLRWLEACERYWAGWQGG